MTKKRSTKKLQDAFAIAERAADGYSQEKQVLDGVLDARPFLQNDDDADAPFEDEELDSDEALGSDDDYDVLNTRFSQTIRDRRKANKDRERRRRRGEEVSDSESDGYKSVDESQFVTLSEAWEMDDRDLEEEKKKEGKAGKEGREGREGKKGREVVLDDRWESESESGSGSDEESDEESDSDSESDEESENDDSVTLSNVLSHLSRKPQKKRLVAETGEENEFSVPSGSLTLEEMMGAVNEDVEAPLLDGQALSVPQAKRIQEKHDRKAAYQIARQEVQKWRDTVQASREADVLHFPVAEPAKPDTSTNAFRPVLDNDLTARVGAVLAESALVDDSKEATFEEIAVARMSPEEMKKRTRELRMMRELMFRDDQRAKRIKKIKSKQYHKVHKKERLRNAELVDEEDEDLDAKRAEERMSLKHKTQSAWAKSLVKSGLSKDASNRAELEEMLREGERLRARQVGTDVVEESLSDIEKEYERDNQEEDEKKRALGKGVLGMDFMRRAEEKKRRENIKEIQEIRGNTDEDSITNEGTSINSTANIGRRVYAPAVAAQKREMEELDAYLEEEIGIDEEKSLERRMRKGREKKEEEVEEEKEEEVDEVDEEKEVEEEKEDNPWISDAPLRSNKITSSSRKRTLDESIEIQQTISAPEAAAFSQIDLIKEAFAGDDVVSEFNAEKKAVAEDEDHKEEDATLPGWGSWGGEDIKPKKRKFVRKIEGVVAQDKRRDKNLKNVIINERVNKKNLKYQSAAVPFPFESREQYERSLRMPIGQEWTSRGTHNDMTTPRVNVKQGVVIDPLKAPF